MVVRGPSWIVCPLSLIYCSICSLGGCLPYPVCHNMNNCAYTARGWPHVYRIHHCKICRFFLAGRWFELFEQWP